MDIYTDSTAAYKQRIAELEEKLALANKFGSAHAIRVGELASENQRLREALVKLRDCDWVITPHDRMDAVRDIARAALEGE